MARKKKKPKPIDVYREKMAQIAKRHARRLARGAPPEQPSPEVQEIIRHPACPFCGAHLLTRFRRQTRQPFLGCSRFPACNYTAPHRTAHR